MTTPTTQPDDRCDQIAREKYYQTGDTCPCCGIGTYLPSGVCGHCDIHRDSEYAAHRRSRILKHENQQPKSEPSRECEQIARELISAWMTKNNYPDARYQGQLREAIAAALQAAKQQGREEVLRELEALSPLQEPDLKQAMDPNL